MTFELGDFVWVHLRKEHFPERRKSKLMPRGDGPFRVLERINDNAYKIELPEDYSVSTTFNVADLTPYFGLEESESRTTPFQEGEDDEAISTKQDVNQAHDVEDVNQPREQENIGPITRSRAKKLKQEVNTLLCEIHFNINEDYILPKSCTLLLLTFTKEDDKNTEDF